MRKQVADRLFLGSISVVVVTIAYIEPASLSYVLRAANGMPAQLCLLALLVVALLALADTIVNDVMPEKYSFKFGVRFRQAIWAFIGITFAGLAFVTSKYGSYLVAAVYFLYAARCIAMSFIDLLYETRDRLHNRRSTDYAELGRF